MVISGSSKIIYGEYGTMGLDSNDNILQSFPMLNETSPNLPVARKSLPNLPSTIDSEISPEIADLISF